MSTLDPSLDSQVVGDLSADGIPRAVPLVGTITTSDHKTIGKALIGMSALGALAVAAVAVALGIERIDGDGTVLDANDLTQLFAAYRVGLVEVVALPFLLGLGVFVVPLQLGARALAFPRLAAAGLWSWLGGAVLLVIALGNNGGPSGGDAKMVELYLAANVLTLAGLAAIAVSVATSVLTTRAPGMRMSRVPVFSWAALVGSLGLVLVLPVAIGTHVLLFIDYRYSKAAFGTANGIWSWTSYLFSGPVLGVCAVFAAGLLADVLAVTLGRRLERRAVALFGVALIGTAAFAGVGQQDVVRLAGTGPEVTIDNFLTKFGFLLNWALLTLLPLLGVLLVFAAGATTAKPQNDRPRQAERPAFTAALVFALLGVLVAALGIAASAVNGIEDLALEGTVFEEGAAVAVVYGSVLAAIGGVAFWFPKWSGRKLPDGPLIGIALLGALGALLASVPYLIAGFLDQPGSSGVYANDGPGELFNVASTAGHALFAFVVIDIVVLGVIAARRGGDAGDDPWHGQTLEWATTSPAPAGNFAATPTVMSAEPLLDLRARPAFASESGEDR